MEKTKNNTAISDEEIIAAILQSGTIREAAGKVGIAERTIYDRMNNRDFRKKYEEAKNEIIRKAVFSINDRLGDAVQAVVDIMTDKDTNSSVRLQAAQTIINNAGKFAERLRGAETTARQLGKDPFDILD